MDLFNSPNVVAERYGKFRPFFRIAKEAVEKQERMRANGNREVERIYSTGSLFGGGGGLLTKEQVPTFNETPLEGDVLGRVFTVDDLKGLGFDDKMIGA